MNRLYIKTIAFAAVSVMLLGSCSREQQNPDDGIRTLTAHIGKQTRVDFDSRTGKFSWSDPDEIALHLSTGAYTNVAVKPSGVFNLVLDAGVTQDCYGVYPSNIVDASNYGNPDLRIELPASYTVDGALGMGDWYPVPMVAVNNPRSDDLWFYHTGGAARLELDDVPAGTAAIVVDFGKRVTGSFTVENPATETPETKTDEVAEGSSVVFNLSTPLAEETDGFVLNIPVPTGTYSFIKVRMEDGSGTTLGEPLESYRQRVFARGRGRKISFSPVDDFVLILEGPLTPLSQYGDEDVVTVTSYATSGGVSSWVDIAKTEYSVDGGTTWSEELPAWLRLTDMQQSADGLSLDCTIKASINRGVSSKVWSSSTTYDENVVTDLSLQDIYGNPIAQSTANCYVVSAPGWYKFPAVYGNALKEGETNEIAYVSKCQDQLALGHFVRHDGNPITAPWIKDNGITLSDACLVWQDVLGLVSNISFANDYITFFVDPGSIFQGNAVIAVRDNQGKIAWSWHIWVMDSPAQKLATKKVYANFDYVTTSGGGVNGVIHATSSVYPLDMMDMNLGWCEEEEIQSAGRALKIRVTQAGSGYTAECDITQEANEPFSSYGNCTLYQWGRKDPMLPGRGDGYVEGHDFVYEGQVIPSDLIASKSQYYDEDDYMWQVADEGVGCTFAESIQHPNVLYNHDSATRDDIWLLPESDGLIHAQDLWNAISRPQGNNYQESDMPVCKTVYDPCPVGFSVPNLYAFGGFIPSRGVDANSGTYLDASLLASNMDSFLADHGFYCYCDYYGASGNPRAETTFLPLCGVRSGGYCLGNVSIYLTACPAIEYRDYDNKWHYAGSGLAISYDYFLSGLIIWYLTNHDADAAGAVRPVREVNISEFTGNAGSYGHDDWNE